MAGIFVSGALTERSGPLASLRSFWPGSFVLPDGLAYL
jgi:hypothetical protein